MKVSLGRLARANASLHEQRKSELVLNEVIEDEGHLSSNDAESSPTTSVSANATADQKEAHDIFD